MDSAADLLSLSQTQVSPVPFNSLVYLIARIADSILSNCLYAKHYGSAIGWPGMRIVCHATSSFLGRGALPSTNLRRPSLVSLLVGTRANTSTLCSKKQLLYDYRATGSLYRLRRQSNKMAEHVIEVLEVLEEPQPSWSDCLTRPFRRQTPNYDGHQDEARSGESLLERVSRPFRQFQQRRREAQERREKELMKQAFEALRQNSGVTDFLQGTQGGRDRRRQAWNWENCFLAALYRNAKADQHIGGLWKAFYLLFTVLTFIILVTE